MLDQMDGNQWKNKMLAVMNPKAYLLWGAVASVGSKSGSRC